MTDRIVVHWLDEAPSCPEGVTFGVPWPRGRLAKEEPVLLRKAGGEPIPTQTWPLAWWPDGSVKWLGIAAVVGPQDGSRFSVVKGQPPLPPTPVVSKRIGIEVFHRVDTGAIRADVADRGIYLLQAIEREGRFASGGATLVCMLEHGRIEGGRQTRTVENLTGVLRKVTIEQPGPVRLVVKMEGVHRGDASGRELLPFTVRLVFFAGLDSIRLMHTIVYDGRPEEDFIAGLGVRFHSPLDGDPHNRHVRFAGGAGGVWAEPVKYLWNQSSDVRERQTGGQGVTAPVDSGLMPVWSDFQLWQDSPDHFLLRKRQDEQFRWVDAAHGRRAPGAAAVSGADGGLGIGIRNFWQSCPSALEVKGASGTETQLTAWLWAPDGPPMDMRHYGGRDHRPVYEAVNPDPAVYSSPLGIARTSELAIWALPAGATNEQFAARAASVPRPPLLVCSPAHHHHCGIFADWSVPDRSTPARRDMETNLDAQLNFYSEQIEQRRWYGFWDFGDVMHSYDDVRHVWRYDVGGFAWDNSELASDLWLWYSFIRTGRADVFRMAEAMTRHVGEVDTFHIGPWAGLGSRHNVLHWGCPCKEPRVSQAGPKRFYHYLTADERTGDLLWEVAHADRARKTNSPVEGQLWARFGPDWAAYCVNWLAAWERSGDARWRDKIVAGMDSVVKSPHGLLVGDQYRYDPGTGALSHSDEYPFDYGLMLLFGGPEIWTELMTVIEHEGFKKALIEFAQLHALERSEHAKLPPDLAERVRNRWGTPRLIAWAAAQLGDARLAHRAWDVLLLGGGFRDDRSHRKPRFSEAVNPLTGKKVSESTLDTNQSAQWGLHVIGCLALVRDALEDVWKK